MKKVVYIIPGGWHSPNQKGYIKIASLFRKRGVTPIPVHILWSRRTLTDYVKQFLEQYKHQKRNKVILFGFSYGAMVAFIVATTIKPEKLILCSLSPYFREDLSRLRPWWRRRESAKRLQDFQNYSFNKIAKRVGCSTILMAGSKEAKELLRRVRFAHRKLERSELVIVPNARHRLEQKEYQDALMKIITKL